MIFLDFNILSTVTIEVTTNVKFGKISLHPRLISSITCEIEGGIELEMIRLGMYMTATLFKGSIEIMMRMTAL